MCENKVGFWVARGHTYRETWVTCGRTDPWGHRAICDTCAQDPAIMADIEAHEESIAADNAASRSAGWGDW